MENNDDNFSFEQTLNKLTLEEKIILMDKFLLAFYELGENLSKTFSSVDENE